MLGCFCRVDADLTIQRRSCAAMWSHVVLANLLRGQDVNKSELIEHIAKQADISKAAAGRALESVIGGVKTTLKKNGTRVSGRLRHLQRDQARSSRRSQPAHRRRDQDQVCQSAEVPARQGVERFGELIFCRVLSSVGRAPPLHGDCRRFEPVSAHQHCPESRPRAGTRPLATMPPRAHLTQRRTLVRLCRVCMSESFPDV